MNVLIIYCHPSEKSYTFQILETLKQTLFFHKCNVEVSDLYAINFQSDMNETEYEREGFANTELAISKDVLEEHKKIEKADCIIFYILFGGVIVLLNSKVGLTECMLLDMPTDRNQIRLT